MTRFTVPLDEARPTFLAALDAFVAAVDALDDLALLGPSRAHGWSRLDCLVHVRAGLQEMLAGLPARTDAAPDVDSASYWTSWEEAADEDPVPGILQTRRTASAYARPTHAMEHLRQVTTGLRHAVTALDDGAHDFQGHVLTSGDLLATWAVELAVHHHDLDLPADLPAPDPAAVRLGRRTADALAGRPDVCRRASDDDGADGDDLTVMLAGFGRG